MKRDLFKNTFIVAIGKFGTQVLSYFLLPLYTTLLSTSEYGTYDLLVTISIFAIPLITIMMEESMFRFLIDEETDKGKTKVISTACIYVLIATLFWCLLSFTVLSIINYQYKTVFIIYLISAILMKLVNGISRGLSQIKIYSLSNFILGVLTIVLNILFIAKFKWGVSGLLYSTVLANLIACFFVFIKLRLWRLINFKDFEMPRLKEMIKYSFPLVPNNISWYIINISDRIIVVSILGSGINGIYAIANKFPNILNSVSGFFHIAFKENASIAVKKDDYEKYYNSIYDTIHNAFIAVSLIIISFLPFVFSIFVKKDYIEAYNYIPFLVIAVYYGNMSVFYGNLFTAFKQSKIIGKSTIVGAIINLVVHLSLIYFVGIYAAIISTIVSNYVVSLYRKIKIQKYVKLKPIKNYYLSIAMLFLITGLYFVKNFYVNIVSLILTIVYILIVNKELIFDIQRMLFKRKKTN